MDTAMKRMKFGQGVGIFVYFVPIAFVRWMNCSCLTGLRWKNENNCHRVLQFSSVYERLIFCYFQIDFCQCWKSYYPCCTTAAGKSVDAAEQDRQEEGRNQERACQRRQEEQEIGSRGESGERRQSAGARAEEGKEESGEKKVNGNKRLESGTGKLILKILYNNAFRIYAWPMMNKLISSAADEIFNIVQFDKKMCRLIRRRKKPQLPNRMRMNLKKSTRKMMVTSSWCCVFWRECATDSTEVSR